MADEEVVKVLRIRAQVEGEAVSKLQAIQQELGKLSTGSTRRSMQAATEQATEFQRAAARLSESALGIGRTFKDLAAVLGPVPIAIGLIGYELVRQINAMKEHARASTEMSQAARRAGLGAGEYALINENLRKAGLNAEQATGTLQGFSRAVAELSIQGSERRQQIMRDAGPYYAELQSGLVKMMQAGSYYKQMQEAQRIANNVAANEFNQSHNARLAAFRKEQILRDLGMEQLIDANKDLEDIEEGRTKHLDEVYAGQEKLNTALDDEQSTREQIYREAMSWTAGFNTALVNLTTEFEKGLLHDLERGSILKPPGEGVQPGLQPGVTKQDWTKKGGVIDPSWGWHNLFGRGGGGATAPQHLSDNADVLGLAPGSLGYGDISKGWRRSTNIEDHSDRVEQQTKEVDQNTEQLHGLNLRMKRWLDQDRGSVPIRAMAEGGIVQGPTRALVGEAGPEAIVSKGGTSVVSKPTQLMLGTDGAQAVVPLTSAGADIDKTVAGFAGQEKYIAGRAQAADLIQTLDGYQKANPQQKNLLRKYMQTGGEGMSAIEEAWCAHTVRSSFRQAGLGESLGGTSAAASSFNTWQRGVDPTQAQRGDVVTLPGIAPFGVGGRGRTGHVGIVTGPYDPNTGSLPYESGNTGTSPGMVKQANLPVGGTGSNRVLSVRRAEPRIQLHAPTQVAAMASGGIVVPMGAPPPGLGGPTTSAAGFSGDSVTAAGHAAYAAAAPHVQNVISNIHSLIAGHQRGISTEPGLAAAFSGQGGDLLRAGLVAATTKEELLGAGIHGVLEPTLTQAGMSKAGAGLTSDVTGILGTSSIVDKMLPALAARGKQAFQLGQAALGYEHETADRKSVDRAAGGGGGSIEGTMTIEQRTENVAKPRREPLFRPTHIDRRAQMTPAQGGPGAQSAEASSISYGW